MLTKLTPTFILPKLKILVTAYQIISNFPFTLNLQFPEKASEVFNALSFVNLSALTLGSPQCYTTFDYVDRIMLTTIAPLIIVAVLVLVFFLHVTVRRKDWRSVVGRYISVFLFITYLVLPSVSTVIFGAFACDNIDPDNVMPGIPTSLRNDYAISCSSPRYRTGLRWAIAMIFVYPVGILILYSTLLYLNRDKIRSKEERGEAARREESQGRDVGMGLVLVADEQAKDEPGATVAEADAVSPASPTRARAGTGAGAGARAGAGAGGDADCGNDCGCGTRSGGGCCGGGGCGRCDNNSNSTLDLYDQIEFLHKAYEGRCWYWEVVETLRRLLLTGILSIVTNGSAEQIVFGIFVAVCFMKLYGYFQPFVDDHNDTLQVRHHSSIITLHSPLVTHRSSIVTHHSYLLTTHHPSLTDHRSSPSTKSSSLSSSRCCCATRV